MSVYQDLPNDLIDQYEAAEIVGVAVSTLKTWRSRNPDLGYYQGFGREIRYYVKSARSTDTTGTSASFQILTRADQ